MKLWTVTKYVADFLPTAKDVRGRDEGGGLFAVTCSINQFYRCVQFTAAGLMGEVEPTDGERSELHLASDIARELRK